MSEDSEKWYAKPLESICSTLKTSKEGLTDGEASQRAHKFGYNLSIQ